MIDIILARVTDVLVCLASISAYVCLVGMVFPTVLLKPIFAFDGSRDRGIRKYKYPEGRAVVYEPHPSVRGYISLYTLFVSDGVKYLRCKATKDVRDIKYTVVLFDNRGAVLDSLSIEDTPEESGKMKTVILPGATSYASVFVNRINRRELPRLPMFKPSNRKCKMFFWIVSVMTVVLALVVRQTVVGFLEMLSAPFDVNIWFVIIAAFLFGALGAKMVISKRRKMGVV